MTNLTPTALETQALIRRVARDRVASRADEIDKSAEYPQDMFDLLRELGIFTPVSYTHLTLPTICSV